MAQVKTAAQMFPLVESWQNSGMTQKEFSQQHQISEHVFCYWVSRYRKARPVKVPIQTSPKPASEAAFIRLSPPAAPATSPTVQTEAPPAGAANTVVELPSGIVLRFSGLVPVGYLKELVGLCSV